MKIDFGEQIGCRVRRELGDPRVGTESQLLHYMKRALNAQGFDFIKKLMWKDGHMVSDDQHYLRARNVKSLKPGDIYAISSSYWQIYSLHEDYNNGQAFFRVTRVESDE